jgi:hypothetical protein
MHELFVLPRRHKGSKALLFFIIGYFSNSIFYRRDVKYAKIIYNIFSSSYHHIINPDSYRDKLTNFQIQSSHQLIIISSHQNHFPIITLTNNQIQSTHHHIIKSSYQLINSPSPSPSAWHFCFASFF